MTLPDVKFVSPAAIARCVVLRSRLFSAVCAAGMCKLTAASGRIPFQN